MSSAYKPNPCLTRRNPPISKQNIYQNSGNYLKEFLGFVPKLKVVDFTTFRTQYKSSMENIISESVKVKKTAVECHTHQ